MNLIRCETNPEEKFLADAILDLKHGSTTYVYKQCILDKLIKQFNDLEIIKEEFYWVVKCKSNQKLKRGRPRKEVLTKEQFESMNYKVGE